MKVKSEPLVVNLPPIVKDVSQGTPRDVNENRFMCSSKLPPECKILYDTATIFDWKKMDSAYEQCVMDVSLADMIRLVLNMVLRSVNQSVLSLFTI